MSEQLTERIERLEFKAVHSGDVIHITTGVGDEAWGYDFEVTGASTIWLDGTLRATNPDGMEVGPAPFALHGCGRWTDRRQNPVQVQETAFTPVYGRLVLGLFLYGKDPATGGLFTFGNPGQEITRLSVAKPQAVKV